MSRPRRHRVVTVLALATAVVAFPLGALASHQFADVPDSNPFHNDIDAIADAGVTSGCGGASYCPSANVTREQMAAFMNRLGALAPGKTPVVNADRLDGLDSSDFLLPGSLAIRSLGPWQRNTFDADTTLLPRSNGTEVLRTGIGSAHIQLFAETPAWVHDVSYGFASVEFCFIGSTVTLDGVTITEADASGNPVWVINDGTNHGVSGDACFVHSRTPSSTGGAISLYLDINFAGAGSAYITTTTWTWERTLI